MRRLQPVFIPIFVLVISICLGAEPVQMAQVGPDGVQRIEIVGGSYFFKPNHIVLKVNIPAEIKVSQESGFIPHDITMNSPKAGMKVQEGAAMIWKPLVPVNPVREVSPMAGAF